ncbi:MAG TPA: PEGA domain-containing protein [Bryobacteraceae bacterium]|nr:PEGA domain-containing protein [Bryobacteraceae bacterium]
MKKIMILLAVVVMAMIPASASAARVFVGGGFGFGPYWGPGPYYWGPAYGYVYAPATGEIKVDTKVKDAEVWIDGAFAGTVKDAHSLHLRPGSYTVEVRHAGQEVLSRQVFVAAGKTVHLHPEL